MQSNLLLKENLIHKLTNNLLLTEHKGDTGDIG